MTSWTFAAAFLAQRRSTLLGTLLQLFKDTLMSVVQLTARSENSVVSNIVTPFLTCNGGPETTQTILAQVPASTGGQAVPPAPWKPGIASASASVEEMDASGIPIDAPAITASISLRS